MNLNNIDITKVSKLTSILIDQYTCIECCKYYVDAETAPCAHALCHFCWSKRRTCPHCDQSFKRSHLSRNEPLQKRTTRVKSLADAFEKLFNINLNEFIMDTQDQESENDPNKKVKGWLASSQNHFSATLQNLEPSDQVIHYTNPINVPLNKIEIRTKVHEKLAHVSTPQDDWDKIELMPDTEDVTKNKENIVGPMNIEPFYVNGSEYTLANPRRSSRKREIKPADTNDKIEINDSLMEKKSSKNSSTETDKNISKTKQNWSSVKRMKKEFSKISKKNRSKLNVSIEMCKKAQAAKTNVLQQANSQVYNIDENTPVEKQIIEKGQVHNDNVEDKISNFKEGATSDMKNDANNKNQYPNEMQQCKAPNVSKSANNKIKDMNSETNAESTHFSKHEKIDENISANATKMPFYKKSALVPKIVETHSNKTLSHTVNSNTAYCNDDIEITIKVGNTITNILIKKKNDVELKVNTDREVQTSLSPNSVKKNTSSRNHNIQNILINVGRDPETDVEQKSTTCSRDEQNKAIVKYVKTVSEKKNTDSADTATAQFEITESVEKELSKVMECVADPIKSKISSNLAENSAPTKKSQNPATKPVDLEFLNDLDIFESESVKDSDVRLLKNVEHAASEILLCTVKTKSRTQKLTDKRNRDTNNEDALPNSKKIKLTDNVEANDSMKPYNSNRNQSESEIINYDAIMGTVFATIDADIEENRPKQKTDRENGHHKQKQTQQVSTSYDKTNCSNVIYDNCNQKDSENVFSVYVTQKEYENVDPVPSNETVPPHLSEPHTVNMLTPVVRRNLKSAGEGMEVDNDLEVINDDSDKSIVEETPQKATSFSKSKQKSNGANNEIIETVMVEVSQPPREISEKETLESAHGKSSVISLTDTSTEMKSNKDLTIIEVENKKSTETPLNINSFYDQVTYKSTPFAKKCLNFGENNMTEHDPEQTICSTNDAVAKTTQEKEFLRLAFEKTPSFTAKPLGLRSLGLRHKKYCIAGSCLTPSEIQKVKLLCTRHKFTYTDTFCDDLTHLVVSVDENLRSQRSVKYMRALASSKWIVSYEWVVKCLQSQEILDEHDYEALDNTGEPGPARSRTATTKLFRGITFYCMEPFSVLDVNTLKAMLQAAGGRVVDGMGEVRVSAGDAPAILLAEPEDTQDNRFTYLTMEQSIVPVNYEWVLNCLGCYTLASIQELLLCPSSILPKGTERWPHVLIACDDE